MRATVRERCRAMASGATGRVLDLGGCDNHERLWTGDDTDAVVLAGAGDEALDQLVREGCRFDAVFSAFQLATAPRLGVLITKLSTLLDPGGQLLFLEPNRCSGTVLGPAQRFVAPVVDAATGWRVDRDIPGALRAHGLSVTDIERHRVTTVQWWLRTMVEGRAHHRLAPDRSR